MTKLLDPWADARELADHLSSPDAELVLLVGASWCSKCQALIEGFAEAARVAQQDHPSQRWLWMDLDDHTEFLGDYNPTDLPLLHYFCTGRLERKAKLIGWDDVHRAYIEDLEVQAEDAEITRVWGLLSAENWSSR